MNLKYVFNVLGKLLAQFSLVFIIPLIAAYIYNESFIPFIAAMIVSFTTGILMSSIQPEGEIKDALLKNWLEEFIPEKIRYKEAFVIVSLSWLSVSLIGSIPYLFHGINPVDAFFESISGFTTTGASVLVPERLPKSLLIWRSLTQWLGGMGIIVLFLAIFPSVAKKGSTLFQAEYPGVTITKIKPRLRDTAISLYLTYLLLSVLEIISLYLLGLSLFDAVNHTFTTLSTGGYSTHSESIAYFGDVRVEFTVAFFAALGGTNFALLYLLLKNNRRIFNDTEFRVYVSFILIFSAILTALNLEKFGLFDSFRYSLFQTVSIMTTTGYTTYDFDTWSDSARFLLLILMFIGGSSGSTAGGIKIVRIYMLIRYSILHIMSAAEPRTVRAIKYGKTIIEKGQLENVAAFFVVYIFVFVISSLIITLSGYDIVTSVSATAATLGNVGPGLGLAGAGENYASFLTHIKLLLCFNMWMGRLELFTVISLFIPSFWRETW
jgi:trk system potassium uptake protein TrkH